jgi:hypothetical protein
VSIVKVFRISSNARQTRNLDIHLHDQNVEI